MKGENYQATLNLSNIIGGESKDRSVGKKVPEKKDDKRLIMVDIHEIFRKGK